MSKMQVTSLGVGSLPHKDPAPALDFIFRNFSDSLFWPQLPKRDMREGMVIQFSENLPYLKLRAEGLSFDQGYREQDLEVFYEKVIANDAEYFKISDGFALGLHEFYRRLEKADLSKVKFIKCQVTGPFTFAAAINDDNGVALLHNKLFFQAAVKALALKATWQIKLFKRFGKKIILFFDEPYLGCFGSAYTPINREDVISVYSELAGSLKSEGTLIGIHCCGNTDWSMLAEVDSIDMLNFDAFDFQERFILYAESLKGFLKKKGMICWGIVPAGEDARQISPADLARRLKSGMEALVKKGLDREMLGERLFISPACGLGTLEVSLAEKVLQLLNDTTSYLQENP
jgi:methionine synthase II (cobalamin-independent)